MEPEIQPADASTVVSPPPGALDVPLNYSTDFPTSRELIPQAWMGVQQIRCDRLHVLSLRPGPLPLRMSYSPPMQQAVLRRPAFFLSIPSALNALIVLITMGDDGAHPRFRIALASTPPGSGPASRLCCPTAVWPVQSVTLAHATNGAASHGTIVLRTFASVRSDRERVQCSLKATRRFFTSASCCPLWLDGAVCIHGTIRRTYLAQSHPRAP